VVSIILIAIIAAVGAAGYLFYRSRRHDARNIRTSASAAGWRGDPTGRHEARYWDGAAWTTQVRTGGVNTTDPL